MKEEEDMGWEMGKWGKMERGHRKGKDSEFMGHVFVIGIVARVGLIKERQIIVRKQCGQIPASPPNYQNSIKKNCSHGYCPHLKKKKHCQLGNILIF